MRFVTGALTTIAAFAAVVSPGRAHACSFAGPTPHTIDPAMVGVDQTPPTLPQPMVAEIHHFESEGCGEANSCDDIASARITNLATDDTTSSDQIGYRFAVVAGTPPPGFSLPTGTARMPIYDGSFYLYWTAGQDVDFTLNLFAVDAAGNQSAPRTLRIQEDTGGCSVGRSARAGVLSLAIVTLALSVLARRRRRTVGALLAIAVVAAVAWPCRARACSAPQPPPPHTIDPAMAGVDQTPPSLPKPMVGNITRLDGSGCDGSSHCGDLTAVYLTNLATDDATPAHKIGYRLTVIAGSGPSTYPYAIEPIAVVDDEPRLPLYLGTYSDDLDFTLQVVAVDAAGNESAPQTVRVHDDVGLCSIGHRGPAGFATFAIMLLVLMVARRRRRQIVGLLR